MAGIDFTQLREQVTLAEVLALVGFRAVTRHGPQWRGRCPVHGSPPRRSRAWAAPVERQWWDCFGRGAGGNALDLYLAVTKLPVYQGALELCARLHKPVLWQTRASSARSRPP